MNKKLKGKSIKYRSVDICTKPIRTLAKCFDEGNYFKVILLAPQVYEQLLEEYQEIDNYNYSDYIARKGLALSKEDQEIDSCYRQLLKEESIKARVLGYLVDIYFSNNDDVKSFSSKEFKKCFTKINNIFSQRNTVAHEYFKKDISSSILLRTANDCFYILDVLLSTP